MFATADTSTAADTTMGVYFSFAAFPRNGAYNLDSSDVASFDADATPCTFFCMNLRDKVTWVNGVNVMFVHAAQYAAATAATMADIGGVVLHIVGKMNQAQFFGFLQNTEQFIHGLHQYPGLMNPV